MFGGAARGRRHLKFTKNSTLKWLFKWGLRCFIVAVVLVVIFLLSLDSILRLMVQYSVHQQTGMKVEIGKFHLGLVEPVIEMKDLRLYNPAGFDHTPFVTIPEIRVEYDREALRRNEVHITDLRFDLGELDVVKSQDGRTNLFALGVGLPPEKPAPGAPNPAAAEFKKRTGIDSVTIDRLNVSVGKFRYTDLQDQKNNREQVIGLNNCVITNVTSMADLAGVAVVVGLRSGDFFAPLVAPGNDKQSAQDLLKMLGH